MRFFNPLYVSTCCLILAVSSSSAAQSSSALTEAQEDSIVATARLYGAVRYFCPSDAVVRLPWDRFLVHAVDQALAIQRSSEIGPSLQRLFASAGPCAEVGQNLESESKLAVPPGRSVEWRHQGLGVGQKTAQQNVYRSWRIGRDDVPSEVPPPSQFLKPLNATTPWSSFPLAAGWNARVRVSMSTSDALITPSMDEEILRMGETLPRWDQRNPRVTRPQAMASGIAAWAVARHFYPYWHAIAVDWDDELRRWLRAQPETQTRAELRLNLRRLLAYLQDGHAGIQDLTSTAPYRQLPIAVRPLDGGYVVSASDVPSIRLGDRIEAINGRAIDAVMRDLDQRTSGGAHARPWLARFELLGSDSKQVNATLRIRRGDDRPIDVEVPYRSGAQPRERRPEPIAELRPGVYYVDLSRFTRSAWEQSLPHISLAQAIIFDLRGYPSSDAIDVVGYWVGEKEEAKWMRVPVFVRPFETPRFETSLGWDVSPKPGIEGTRKVLMTDPRAISYSESIAGYFAAYAKGQIVGEPTAGANGNVSTIELPGGYSMRFTGMYVTTHKTGESIQARGFQPDVVVVPTVEGIAAGRDEVLERALEIAGQS